MYPSTYHLVPDLFHLLMDVSIYLSPFAGPVVPPEHVLSSAPPDSPTPSSPAHPQACQLAQLHVCLRCSHAGMPVLIPHRYVCFTPADVTCRSTNAAHAQACLRCSHAGIPVPLTCRYTCLTPAGIPTLLTCRHANSTHTQGCH